MGGQEPKRTITMHSEINPYRDNVQAKANEPITVAGLLDRAKSLLGPAYEGPKPDWTQDEIYDRLEANAPRVAIIGGSPDHPAHILDLETIARAAVRIWQNGGVPFCFSTPVLCDGTAQSTSGMSYSLQSRNAIAEMVVSQMEAHIYHAAFVIQGCDKQPLGVLSGLAHLDRVRRLRGESPVAATFAPTHVLKGGTIPDDLRDELLQIAAAAESAGFADMADDIRDALSYILQCTSNTAFQGVLARAAEQGLITAGQHKSFEKRLAVSTCDAKGGICAFHGTGNSSRDVMAGFGFVHPALELLVEPPGQQQVNQAVDGLFAILNRPECGAAELVKANIGNALRIHSAAGGSTNLMMHIVGAMIYAGYDFSIWDVERILQEHPVPDLFDYSLTEGRDIYVLAQQCCSGQIRGMETLFYELQNNGVPMDADAMTVTGRTWRERLADRTGLSADGVTESRIILSKPRRSFSGVDVLRSGFFESAVVKVSGMPTKQLDHFDDKLAFVLYFENEEAANAQLLDVRLLEKLRAERAFALPLMRRMWERNAPETLDSAPPQDAGYDAWWDAMIEREVMRVAVVISGQGPAAFGMPEMFTPMQHINANRQLKRLATLISDGRYSGVTYGAAIGHVTPEAIAGGGILYLQQGDVLQLRFRAKRIELLDAQELAAGRIAEHAGLLQEQRAALGAARLERLRARRRRVAASNRMGGCTDAARGVVPASVMEEAELPWR
ncbi:Dihydroxy-acid dehydratase [Paenibacillus konkukensis]|uniref:Dihydroxy-acid dehydratase n=1 Tax=Paenibacillus konkukensis TaxID=2020716 RepID=A0ABY4RKE7_9BACL|nr:dihydroxy-acid dehydratase [Paenibacillus konkukensis]UQZ82929.1 Dihydroxy-acid dehydratase [Paenibacillus konkukensis]